MHSARPDREGSHTRRILTAAVLCQVFGLLGMQTIEQNGLLILYLRRLGVPAAGTLGLLSLFSITVGVARIPLSHMADRIGRKRVGTAGTLLGTAAILFIAAAGSLSIEVLRIAAISGLVLFALGEAFFGAGWFSVLHPLVPEHRRGSFFGVLRIAWQAVGIGFTAAASLLLDRYPEVWMYQLVFLAVALGAFARVLLYRVLPETEPPTRERPSLRDALHRITRLPGFMGYLVYIGFRFLFMGAAIQVLALLEREALGLSDGTVVAFANYGLIGNILGFVIAALVVDRMGRHHLFRVTHALLILVLGAFVSRAFIPGYPVAALYPPLHVLLGMGIASFSVARTAEEFSLVHIESKALALSFVGFAFVGGRAAGRLTSSLLLGKRGLPTAIEIFGASLSQYDVVVGIMMLGMLVTLPLLRLVPAVRHRR